MRVTFNSELIQSASGKITPNGEYYFMTRNGHSFLCHRESKNKRVVTPSSKQSRQQEAFKQMTQITREIMQTSHLRRQYEEGFKKQKKYSSLRGYIAHCVAAEKKSS